MVTSRQIEMATRFLAMAVIITMSGWMLAGCGGEEPAAPEQPAPTVAVPEAKEAPAPAVTPPPAAPKAAPGDIRPVTLDLLKMAPAQAQLALALPPLNGVVAKALPLAKRLAPEGVDIDKEWAAIVADLATDAGVEGAATLGDVAAAKGINLDAPMALFADFTASANSVKAAMEAIQAASAPAETPAAAEAPVAGGGAEAEGGAEAAPATPAAPDAASGAEPTIAALDLDDVEMPSLAMLLGVADQAKAEATIQELIGLTPDLGSKAGDPVAVNDISIKVYDKYGYFFSGNMLAVGSLDMVKTVAERVSNPVEVRYGTVDCPADAPDEMAMLMYGSRFLPLLKQVLPAMPIEPEFKPFLDAQVATLEGMLSGSADDPIVSTFALAEDKIELKSMMDTATHPGILPLTGQAAPLRYAQMLPEGTVALISLRLTPEYKKLITERYLTGLPAEIAKDPGTASAVAMAGQVINMLGDEVTLGVAGATEELPTAFLLMGLSNPEPTKGLIQALVPTMPSETYNEVEIGAIQAPTPVPLSIAFAGDTLFVSNSVDKMKPVIDLLKESKTTNLFAALQPPLDPNVPRYSLLMLNASLLTDVVVPLASLAGGVPEEAKPIIDQVTSVLGEVRAVSEMAGSWQISKVSLYLKPPASM